MSEQQILEQATRFAAEEVFGEVAWRNRAKVVLADAVTLALAADAVPGVTELFELGTGEGSHLSWPTGRWLGAADAVQANSGAVCARFQDDNDSSSWSHPGSFVVPAAVAASVESGSSYGSLLDGLIAGYAVTTWLGGDGTVAHGVKQSGRRPSPTFGVAGASAAASRAAGLTAEQTTHAVSAALLLGRGTLHSVGAGGDDWRLHNPSASRDGFICALAARAGMTTGPGALDAENGFLAAFAGLDRVPHQLSRPPRAAAILEVWQKALPTLGDNMAVGLAAQVLHDPRRVSDFDEVTIHMNADFTRFPGTQTRPPYETLTSALASVHFVTAQLLVHGTLDFDAYSNRNDPMVTSVAQRSVVIPHEDYGHLDALVEISAGGRQASYSAADLPRAKFHRDGPEQRRVARELLGPGGESLVAALLNADENSPAEAVVHDAIAAFHSVADKAQRAGDRV